MSHGLEVLYEVAARKRLEAPVDLFYFVRHGETAGNFDRIIQHPTISLNERGFAQADRAGRIMARIAFDRIEASTFTRAHQTAQAIERHTGRPLRTNPNLSERLFGELMGTSAENLDWTASPAGGETLDEFVARTRKGFTEAVADGGVPTLVAHGGNLRVIAAGLGVELPLGSVGNAQPLRFERKAGVWHLTMLHETE